jgi:hypothetical protein
MVDFALHGILLAQNILIILRKEYFMSLRCDARSRMASKFV